MRRSEKIWRRIAKIEQALADIKSELSALEPPAPPAPEPLAAAVPDAERLRREYRRLYQEFVADGPLVVERYVAAHSEQVLIALCRANDIGSESEDLTASRASIRLMQAFARQRASERHRA